MADTVLRVHVRKNGEDGLRVNCYALDPERPNERPRRVARFYTTSAAWALHLSKRFLPDRSTQVMEDPDTLGLSTE